MTGEEKPQGETSQEDRKKEEQGQTLKKAHIKVVVAAEKYAENLDHILNRKMKKEMKVKKKEKRWQRM